MSFPKTLDILHYNNCPVKVMQYFNSFFIIQKRYKGIIYMEAGEEAQDRGQFMT